MVLERPVAVQQLFYWVMLPILSKIALFNFRWCSHTVTATASMNSSLILSDRSDSLVDNNLFIAVHIFPMPMFILISLNERLFPRYVKWFTNFRDLPYGGKWHHLFTKDMTSVSSASMQRSTPLASSFRIPYRYSAKALVFSRFACFSTLCFRDSLCGILSVFFFFALFLV